VRRDHTILAIVMPPGAAVAAARGSIPMMGLRKTAESIRKC